MEAEAEFDFIATADDELSFRKGQILKVHIPINTMLPISSFVEN